MECYAGLLVGLLGFGLLLLLRESVLELLGLDEIDEDYDDTGWGGQDELEDD